ncbi:hypothetical protein M433DRAFT_8759 [Acidomyces richmondensis BFW]|nr:hypothetical protein M433DRAFT_8759 [Acidomyces richmondensis BFW]
MPLKLWRTNPGGLTEVAVDERTIKQCAERTIKQCAERTIKQRAERTIKQAW